MTRVDADVAALAECTAADLRPSEPALSRTDAHAGVTEAEAAADRVAEHWADAPKSLVRACASLVAGLNGFANEPEKREVFLQRLITKRVLSSNDVLTRLKANGKLAMLQKIGRYAETLLQAAVACLLPAHYSIIYQICLLIDEVGLERALPELHPDLTRDDVIRIRVTLKPSKDRTASQSSSAPFDDVSTELFAVDLAGQDHRLLANNYARADTLDECLNRPKPAENAGLVAIVLLRMLGTFERTLMPLLGFGAICALFMEKGVDQPDITNHNVIVVSKRGNFRPHPLTVFPASLGPADILTLADTFFPHCTVKCQIFARQRAEGWLTLIDDENWKERPTVR